MTFIENRLCVGFVNHWAGRWCVVLLLLCVRCGLGSLHFRNPAFLGDFVGFSKHEKSLLSVAIGLLQGGFLGLPKSNLARVQSCWRSGQVCGRLGACSGQRRSDEATVGGF